MSRWTFALLLLACDDGGGGRVYQPVPPQDAAPTPDAAPPDVGREGPPTLAFAPAPLVVREGRTEAVSITLAGTLDGPTDLELTAEGVAVEPRRLRFEPTGPRSQTVAVTAHFDADEVDAEGRLRAFGGGVEGEIPIRVPDVHLTFTLELDDEQLAFVRTSNDESRRLAVGTRIRGAAGPDAEINLRGKGTLTCPRRSFTVRFDEPARFGDSPPLDHVLLLSMCLDATYLKMRTSNEVLAANGLFPGWYSLAEVRYGAETRGVYLVVERPRKALPRVFPDNTMVVRRITDQDLEIKRPDEADIADPDAFLAPYRALYALRGQHAGADQLAALRAHMDYDGYLRWLAINSALHNGDYIDEVYFYDRRGPAGAAAPYYAIMAWDYDDIFNNCHTRGPLDEPLLYCAESGLDRPVRDTPEVTDAYLGYLRGLMAGALAPEPYGALVQRVADEMAVYLARPGVVAVMTRESGPPDLAAGVEAMRAGLAARRAELEAVMP